LIKVICFVNTVVEDPFKICEGLFSFIAVIAQAQTDRCRVAWPNRGLVIRRGLRAFILGIDRLLIAVNDVVVDSVFGVVRTVREVEQSLRVCIVFGKEKFRRAVTVQPAFANSVVIELDDAFVRTAQPWFRRAVLVP
jgi:hypothetical protein